jgi:RNA polymerase sigma-70 factor (ECF subfamily)
MDKLPDQQARVLKMKTVEGLDYKEIAETTGLSQVHVRVLVSTARKTLKRRLRI